MAIKSLSIRIDENMLNKLHVVADYEGRSANSQMLVLIRDCIEEYEQKHKDHFVHTKYMSGAEKKEFILKNIKKG